LSQIIDLVNYLIIDFNQIEFKKHLDNGFG